MRTDQDTLPRGEAALPALGRSSRIGRWTAWPAAMALLVVGTALLWRAFNAPPGSVGLEFPFDLVFYYIPMMEQAAERLRAGELPLWNPYQCCGVPFLATAQAGVFYPGTWLALLMPVTPAVQVLMFAQVLLSGVFMTGFLRAAGRGLYAAAIGGLLFLFGCSLGQIYWPSQVATVMWMPLLFWAVERYVQTGRRRWWAIFAISLALQILAGYPQFLVYTFYLLGPYTLLRLIQTRRGVGKQTAGGKTMMDGGRSIINDLSQNPRNPPARRRCHMGWGIGSKAISLAGAGALAIGLTAVQLLPTAELARETARTHRLTEDDVHYLEHERDKYLTLDRWFHNALDPSQKMITFDFPDGSGYLGMLTPMMAILGVAAGRRDRRTWLFAAAAGLFFMLAFGYSSWSGGLYRLYAHLPTGHMFRTPSRLLLLTYFCLITLSAGGLDYWARGWRNSDRTVVNVVGLALIAAMVIAMAAAASGGMGAGMAIAYTAILLSAALIRPTSLWRHIVLAALPVLLVVDLFQATAPYGSLRDIPIEWGRQPHWGGVTPMDRRDFAAAITEAGLNRVALPPLRPTKLARIPGVPRFYSVNDYEPLLPKRWTYTNRRLGGETGFILAGADPDRFGPFYDLCSVTHLFHTRIDDRVRARLGPIQWEIHTREPLPAPPGMTCTLEHRDAALPRAYTVGRYERCDSHAALERVATADFDYENAVLLEGDPGFPSGDASEHRGPAETLSYTPQHVVVRAEVPGPRLLVLTDSIFPGWQARVDDTPVPILTANYLFRAVALPAGAHEVIFEYHPISFRMGAVISLVSVGILGICWVAGGFKRNRGQTANRPLRHRARIN